MSLCDNCKTVSCDKISDEKKRCKSHKPILEEEDINNLIEYFLAISRSLYFEGYNDGRDKGFEDYKKMNE